MMARTAALVWRLASAFAVILALNIGVGCGSPGPARAPTSPSAIAEISLELLAPPYAGLTVGVRAVARRADGGLSNVTALAVWSTSDETRAAFTSPGVLAVVAPGPLEIRADVDGVIGRLSTEAIVIPVVTGSVTDRIEGGPIDGSMIQFDGAISTRVPVSGGAYSARLVPGQYEVSITGPSHVEHRDRTVDLLTSRVADFAVLKWGSGRFGAIYDERFHHFFHQVARVTVANGPQALRKWVVQPDEVYVVTGAVPSTNLTQLVEILSDLAATDLPQLWCGYAKPLRVTTGPEASDADGRITVRPSLDGGASGSLGLPETRRGHVTIAFVNRITREPVPSSDIRSALLHEFYHVAFGFHLCGGDLGVNPFGYGPGNCPFPDSVMANSGRLIPELSPQDKLAACIVYHPQTTPANAFPDINR